MPKIPTSSSRCIFTKFGKNGTRSTANICSDDDQFGCRRLPCPYRSTFVAPDTPIRLYIRVRYCPGGTVRATSQRPLFCKGSRQT